MNLPNKLTLLRIALVPLIVLFMLLRFPLSYLIAYALFGVAAITDHFDGKIARRDKLITDFGKFADPLADKILVISILVVFVKHDLCQAVPLIIILFREFSVTSIRLVAAARGKVIAANMWGKVKTVCQIVAICVVFTLESVFDIISLATDNVVVLYDVMNVFKTIDYVFIWIATAVTVISGIKYLVDNKSVISDI
ncbi:MAG: CDP-diacylglycerol--glycerol-3-phosphate 3-phosphatidyltransferase [Ruminococcus sp.]|nr:CDP-diacylglycerol--glycerol-3-phosphate 3-phosphatidyltransferase [Ruminococcus sp.]